MWERSQRAPFDNSAGSDIVYTSLCSDEWIAYQLGHWPEKYQAIERLVLFTSLIRPIELSLRSYPEIRIRFLMNVRFRKEFDVADQNSFEVAEVYTKMCTFNCTKKDPSWPFEQLFSLMDIESRLFMAQLEHGYAQTFLTRDLVKRDLASCFGLRSELI